MQAYAKEKHLGAALVWPANDGAKSVDLPAAVLQYPVRLNESAVGKKWQQRDPITEIVVPMAVLESLGRDVFAGQLVHVSSAGDPDAKHVARIIPVEACEGQLIPQFAASALGIQADACTDLSKRPVALLSPYLAFNMGIPYHLAQLLPANDMSKRLHAKSNRVIISTFGQAPPNCGLTVRKAWVPGNMLQELPLAEEVGLMRIAHPEKAPPFNIVDHVDQMQAMASAMSGGAPPAAPDPEEPVDDEHGDELQKAEQAAAEADVMEGLQGYLAGRQLTICLGDVVGVVVQATPLLGAVQTAHNPCDKKQRRVVYFKVTVMKAARDGDAPAGAAQPDTLRQALMVDSTRCNVMMNAGVAASDVPVGGEEYLLHEPEAATAAAGAAAGASHGTGNGVDADAAGTPPPPGRLGAETYGVLATRHMDNERRLLIGPWRELATQMVPFLHPLSKAPGAGRPRTEGRLAVLLHGPEGSGKSLEVHGAAAACGLRVLEVDGRSLSGGNPMDEAACITQLVSTITMAREYAPVVLLIRRMERIFPPQSNPAVIKRFADTLAHLNSCYCSPHVPELIVPAEGMEEGEVMKPEEIVLRNLPWAALHGDRDESGARIAMPQGVTSRELAATHERYTPGVVLVVATTSKVAEVPTVLRRCFTTEYALPGFSDTQRREVSGMDDDDLASAAQATAGFSACDLGASACDAVLGIMNEALTADTSANVKEVLKERVGIANVEGTLEEVRKRVALDIGAPKIPKVRWDDVGGLEDVKRAILDTIELPLKYRDLFSSGLKRRSGVLLYGPPGTGKTLMAKAVATECTINFMSVKGPELINMYVGESEKNVRDVFEQARKAQPCVLFFDELDSLAPRRGTGMDSSHVSDRVVAQLLAELDGIGGGRNDVYVVGATNRPDLLDSALMRPGRLDVLLYVGVDRTTEAKLKVLKALTRKFDMSENVRLDDIATHIPLQCTGADLYGLCSDAWMHALRRTIASCQANGRASRENDDDELDDVEICVDMSDFTSALGNLVPSLTVADLDRYDGIKEQYSPSQSSISKTAASATSTATPALKLRPHAVVVESPKVKGQGLQLPSRKKPAKEAKIDLAGEGFL